MKKDKACMGTKVKMTEQLSTQLLFKRNKYK